MIHAISILPVLCEIVFCGCAVSETWVFPFRGTVFWSVCGKDLSLYGR